MQQFKLRYYVFKFKKIMRKLFNWSLIFLYDLHFFWSYFYRLWHLNIYSISGRNFHIKVVYHLRFPRYMSLDFKKFKIPICVLIFKMPNNEG